MGEAKRGPGRPQIGDPILVRLRHDQIADLGRAATASGMSRAMLIRNAVDDWLDTWLEGFIDSGQDAKKPPTRA